MKKILMSICLVFGIANADSLSESNSAVLNASGKTYNLVVDMNKDVSFYDRNRGFGLEYVQRLVNDCKQYKATCNIKVVVHAKAFPMLVKSGKVGKKIVKPYVNYNPSVIANLQASGVEFITSANSLKDYAVNPNDLLPNINIADSSVFFEADMVKKGFFVVQQ